MEDYKLFEELFDKKIINIIKVMLKDSQKEYYLQELSKEANVPMASTSRILTKLGKLDIIAITKISRFKLYKLQSNKKVEMLTTVFKEETKILEKFIERVKSLPGLKSIVLHGKKLPNRANLLLIGDNLDPGLIKSISAEIKEQHGFIISSLSVNHEQYLQMSHMGLYSGEKKVIYGENLD